MGVIQSDICIHHSSEYSHSSCHLLLDEFYISTDCKVLFFSFLGAIKTCGPGQLSPLIPSFLLFTTHIFTFILSSTCCIKAFHPKVRAFMHVYIKIYSSRNSDIVWFLCAIRNTYNIQQSQHYKAADFSLETWSIVQNHF